MSSSPDAQDREPLTDKSIPILGITDSQPQETMVMIPSCSLQVRDHLVWSIFNTVWMNVCCLGLLALVFSVKSRDRKLLGDRSGATAYSSTARALNITATVITIIIILVTLITAFVNGPFNVPPV